MQISLQHKMYKAIAILLVLVLFSCKKKDQDSPKAGPPAPTKANCSFLIEKVVYADHDTIRQAVYGLSAFFTDTLHDLGNYGPTNALDIGQVSVNNIVLQKYLYQYSSSFLYNDTTHFAFNPPLKISISGGSGISPITFTNPVKYPVYEGFKLLPDTIYLHQGVTIPVVNGFNVDEIVIHMQGSDMSQTVYKPVSALYASYPVFSPLDLQILNYASYCFIYVDLYKNSFQTIGNKIYYVRMCYSFKYYAIVSP